MKIVKEKINNEYILKSKKRGDEKFVSNEKKIIIGKYTSSSLKISNNIKIRPNLLKIISFNENYIKEQLSPNKFNIIKCGKILFKIYLKSVLNDEIKKTLEFNIYVNNKLEKTVEYPIKENFNKNIILSADLNVKKGDFIYFNYSLKEKKGNLNLSNSIHYRIKFFEDFLKNENNDNYDIKNNKKNILLNQIIDNENKILNLKKRLSKLQLKADNLELPIGTIIISGLNKPPYGVWEDLGALYEGKGIICEIEKVTSRGNIINHNHIWSNKYTTIENLENDNTALASFNTFQNGKSFVIGSNNGTLVNKLAYTNLVGSEYNIGYGLGIGYNIYVYKRIS
ncbi:MAG: hypothetical protein HPAVJP_3020 [Candidatus Hepatoplasma vulgare]|nr:MAG: hypothetical protein HPAVJP_3020 [Candidatus Hepatoplasma sp.]